MSSQPEDSCQNADIERDKALLFNTIQVLDEEKENILTEVLRCYVCLELPKGKQVRICEGGHHCCITCHKKIRFCGICRGNLLEGRNFVVEQLVTKLGPILGLPKNELPPAGPPKSLPSGYFKCLHQCPVRVPAFQMLPHLRTKHSINLLENIRSNPYSSRFNFQFNVLFVQNEKFVRSTYVSDMGLFTTVIDFSDSSFCGCVRMLSKETVTSMFKYQMVLKVPARNSDSVLEFSVTNCQISGYLEEVENIGTRGNCLRVLKDQLLEYSDVGSEATVFVSVWEKKERLRSQDIAVPSLTCAPERHLHFEDNRRTRRNRNRNMRRKRSRNSAGLDDIEEHCVEEIIVKFIF